MSTIQDLRPTFLIARAFGLAPYSITRSSISLSKGAIAYSVPWLLVYLFTMYNRLVTYFTEDVEFQYRVLSVTRTILAVCTHIVDVILCIARDKKMQSALNYVRKYDLAVKYDVETNARILRIHSWTVFGFMILYFLVIGWFTYFYELCASLMAAITYVYLYLPMFIGVMKFVILTSSIFLRFRHLNRMLFPGVFSIMMEVEDSKRLHLRDVCWLHSCLFSAAENINSLYSIQLLLWFANFTFNTITRINALMAFEKSMEVVKFARDCGLVCLFVLLSCLTVGICHFTSAQANKVGTVVFSPRSKYFRLHIELDKEDKFSIGQYFAQHPLHFTAASGFFRINLPLLLKIAGAMTTYLVILQSPTKC